MEISAIIFFRRHTRLTVRFRHHLYSGQVPELAERLFAILPDLRSHLCYNRHGLSFAEEVRDTELGHVFEHVLLAILKQRGVFTRGQTTWNWQRDPIGTYQVTIGTGKKLLVKESLLIAQAIFTNALLGPVLCLELPATVERPTAPISLLAPYQRRGEGLGKPARHTPGRLLFAAGGRVPNPTDPDGAGKVGDDDGTSEGRTPLVTGG